MIEAFVSPGFYLVSIFAVLLNRARLCLSEKVKTIVFLLMNIGLLRICGLLGLKDAIVLTMILTAIYFSVVTTSARAARRYSVIAGTLVGGFFLIKSNILIHRFEHQLVALRIVGLSYIFLKLVSFVLDFQAGKIKNPGLFSFLAHIFFLPTFVAGPVFRYRDYAAQPRQTLSASRAEIEASVDRIAQGVFKKLIIAPIFTVYSFPTVLNATPNFAPYLGGAFIYSFVIYFDFSGYSDIAIGLGRLLGFVVPENFNSPYLKRNLIEFWNAWHMSFSSWLRDYLFMPIGQRLFRTKLKRSPILLATVAYSITFLLCGLWHGVTLAFAIWGLYHAAGLSTCKAYTSFVKKTPTSFLTKLSRSKLGYPVSTLVTFSYVSFGWLFFALDTPTLLAILRFHRW